MIRTDKEQERLAKESVDSGYGYVCMLYTKEQTWYVAEVFESLNKVADWWIEQEKEARVYRVRDGVVSLFSAK